jgi:hypothetical protein
MSNRHGQICQSCDNFTVEQTCFGEYDKGEAGHGTLINSCPKTDLIERREIPRLSPNEKKWGDREYCRGFASKQDHEEIDTE